MGINALALVVTLSYLHFEILRAIAYIMSFTQTGSIVLYVYRNASIK